MLLILTPCFFVSQRPNSSITSSISFQMLSKKKKKKYLTSFPPSRRRYSGVSACTASHMLPSAAPPQPSSVVTRDPYFCVM